MRVLILKDRPDVGQIRDMPTMMARAALKAGTVEMVAKDVCQLCGGLYVEVPTLSAEPSRFQCQVCGAARVEAPAPRPELKPPASRRSRRARTAAAGADE